MAATVHFVVDMSGQSLAPYEQVCVFGNAKELGVWNAHKALMLTRTRDYNQWIGETSVPRLVTVRYRYFVAAIDPQTGEIQVRYWETNGRARECKVTGSTCTCYDNFGYIDGNEHKVQRGWLNVGQIVIFKLFEAPLPFHSTYQMRLMLETVHTQTKAPLLSSTNSHIHYSLLRYGNSALQEQPNYGVEYNPDDILIFHVRTLEKDDVSYVFKLFANNRDNAQVRQLSEESVPSSALDKSEGEIELNFRNTMYSEMLDVATLQVKYLVVKAMPEWQVGLSATLVDYWPTHWKKFDVGHRGLGRSFVEQNPANVTENTLGAVVESFNLGADMVEFDVSVTKDLIPVIYHDFEVKAYSGSTVPECAEDLTNKMIKDITYEELRNLKTYQTIGRRIVSYPAANSVENEAERLFPALADFFTKVDKMLGFNIEIKWPQQYYNGGTESVQSIDKNLFVDAILLVVQRFSWGRVCFFSSFDTDICIMLRYKQNMYPVFLLVAGKRQEYMDPCTHCLQPAISTAQAFELHGVVANANIFEHHPEATDLAKRQNKKLILWGDLLSHRDVIEEYKAKGVDAVIYDRLDFILGEGRRNFFQEDTELQKLMTLQYSCSQK